MYFFPESCADVSDGLPAENSAKTIPINRMIFIFACFNIE